MKVRKGFVSNSSSSSFVISPIAEDAFSHNQISDPKLNSKKLNVVEAVAYMRKRSKYKMIVHEFDYSFYPYFSFEKGKICHYIEPDDPSGPLDKYEIEKFVYEFYDEVFYIKGENK